MSASDVYHRMVRQLRELGWTDSRINEILIEPPSRPEFNGFVHVVDKHPAAMRCPGCNAGQLEPHSPRCILRFRATDPVQQAVDRWIDMERKAKAYRWIVENLQAGSLVFEHFTVEFDDIVSGRLEKVIAAHQGSMGRAWLAEVHAALDQSAPPGVTPHVEPGQ